jgi:3'(2'), 5'-bisphosphate nucleotidase
MPRRAQRFGAPVIRIASVEDAAAVASLVIGTGGCPATTPAWAAQMFASLLVAPEFRALVATEGQEVVGYAELHARPSLVHGCREGWLAVLAVAPGRRDHGVEERLLEAVDREAALMGCRLIVVDLSPDRAERQARFGSHGFDGDLGACTLRREVPLPDLGLGERFLALAARAASEVRAAITGLERRPPVSMGADGAPTEAADLAAERAAATALSELGLPVVSEESGLLGPGVIGPGEPWICIDPLDGSRNFHCGLGPYATSFGLVLDGRSVAGYVCDLASGRRWWGIPGSGAWVDGRPARPRTQRVAALPSPEQRRPAPAVDGYERIRISGSTTVDLCRVADGSVGAFVDVDRGVVHVHDLAGPLAVLLGAGAGVVSPDGDITLTPDPARRYRLVAASSGAEAARVCAAQAKGIRPASM